MKYSIIQALKSFIYSGRVISKNEFGKFGSHSVLSNKITLSNPSNIFIDDHVSIDENAILFATNAKIVIKKYFVSAIGLKISTGNHERRVGRFLGSITEKEKNHHIGLDKDVVINEDVWAGFNVTILSGVIIGRGCTIAAGSVVTKSLPPYCIAGGVPARVLGFYWSLDEILEHESIIYPKDERFTREMLEEILNTKY